jgi:tetratricopeptide (TPR) repeat protein
MTHRRAANSSHAPSCGAVRAAALLTVALVVAAAGAAGRAGAEDAQPAALDAPYRAPYLPTDDAVDLQDVPSRRDPGVMEMLRSRKALESSPRDLSAALRLADAYIDFGREVGDAHYAGYAEAVIAPWVGSSQPPAGALLRQATILQYRHEFAPARALLRRTLGLDRGNAQAWLDLATLDMVQGDYAAAGRDCVEVSAGAGVEWGVACSASLRSYRGQARQSLALLDQIESGAEHRVAGGPAGYRIWTLGLGAEAAERIGAWSIAEDHYRRALALKPEDNFLLVGYADFLLDRGRPREVLTLLGAHSQSDTAFLRLALAKAALHDPDASRYAWIMAARFEALRQRGSDFFGREQARFALELQHDPATALELARQNWTQQREPWDTRLLLAAALAAERPRAAAEALAFVQTNHLEDPVIGGLAEELRTRIESSAAVLP